MKDDLASPIAICFNPDLPLNQARACDAPACLSEILAHAGIFHRAIPASDLANHLKSIRLLVSLGELSLSDASADAFRGWLEDGGAWIAICGAAGLEDALGVKFESPAYSSWGGGLSVLGEGYLKPEAVDHPLLRDTDIPLHFFNGAPAIADGAKPLACVLDAHGRETNRIALSETLVGKGKTIFIAPDLPGAVSRIRQGVSVTRDGIPASDGTAPVSDGVLKSDDGMSLDWIFDRQPVDGVPGFRAFLKPVADMWADLLIRAVVHLSEAISLPSPILWYHPRGLPALGSLSHDSDGNDDALARRLLKTLAKAKARSSWCVMTPGYTPERIAEIRGAGHELAMHYNAMDDGYDWSEAEFARQNRELSKLFGRKPTTNKNHYLRWEGDIEFYEWCERAGIRLDQSKGASKTGEAGFNFGTCHPYFPLTPQGKTLDVLEMTTPTQDLEVFAPKTLLKPLLDATMKHHGVLHLLFHPAHIEKPGVEDAIIEAVESARSAGMDWLPAEEIGDWERARRAASILSVEALGDEIRWRMRFPQPIPEATLLFGATDGRFWMNGVEIPSRIVERWGARFHAILVDMKGECELVRKGILS